MGGRNNYAYAFGYNIMDDKINRKYLYKVFLITLKVLPYLIAVSYIFFTLGFYFGVELNVLGYFSSCSILTWLLLYISSFVFGFCSYHRVPLYYVLLNDVLNVVDTYIGLPIETNDFFVLHIALLGVAMLLYVFLRLKIKAHHAQ